MTGRMTTDEAMGAYTRMSEVMLLLSQGNSVTLDKNDLDWLERVYFLLPELPLPERGL